MAEYDNTNRGTLSKNKSKLTDSHPDIRGQLNVDGVEYWLDGWLRQRKDGSGSFYSLSVRAKDAPVPKSRPAQKSATKPKPTTSGAAQDPFGDEDIPF